MTARTHRRVDDVIATSPSTAITMIDFVGSMSRIQRSTEMHTMHEALAREHMRQLQHRAQQHALASRLASANRWHYLERRARASYQRHAERAQRAQQSLAVAE